MKRRYRILTGKATSKSVAEQAAGLAALQSWAKHSLEEVSATMGLMMLDLMLTAEIQERTGKRGRQVAYRHGHQPGYVVWGGRKVPVHRPRLRAKGGGERPLETYQRFQQDGAMQRAVARQMFRKCSTRDYAGAIEEAIEGYGTAKSCASRHFQQATAKQLQQLMEREVPKDLVALMVDAKHFADQCLVVALGITARGQKQVLGLWQGSTENTTVVKELLGPSFL